MYLIQDVQILMNSWMIHVLKLENLNQIFQHHVIDSTTGMLADLDAKNGVANMRAEELLERYNKSGIDSLFNKFSDSRKAISAPKVGEYVQFQEILKVPVNGNETPKSLDDFWGE